MLIVQRAAGRSKKNNRVSMLIELHRLNVPLKEILDHQRN